MERKNVVLICVAIIVVVVIACGAMVYLNSVKDTNLSLKDKTIYKNEKLTFTLTDENNNYLPNKNITVNITSSKNKTKTYNLTTNNKGVAKLKMKNKGKFTVNVLFAGELFLKSSNLTKKVNIKEKEVKKTTTLSNKGYTILSKRTMWDDGSPCTDEVYLIRLNNGQEACLYNGVIQPAGYFV